MKEMISAIRDLEKRGFDCVKPIERIYKNKKDFLYNENKNIKGGYTFAGMEEYVRYECWMKKVD
ncbi:hypothetical protein [Bacillus cereus group sp. BfR-BA-01380]|uniref:hypothetical protein n=1 Tax=Bacillus cereus group sp. BfR-BA-01380 TaxID=2920324 RepID=UPI001F59AB55|nr:hypothetical protein [Bacillus cereus group sp. BfR-BA-01380]